MINNMTTFAEKFDLMCSTIYERCKYKKFWGERGNRTKFEAALNHIHGDLIIALQLDKKNPYPAPVEKVSENISPYSDIEEKLADAIIKIMKLGAARSYQIGEAITAKYEYDKRH